MVISIGTIFVIIASFFPTQCHGFVRFDTPNDPDVREDLWLYPSNEEIFEQGSSICVEYNGFTWFSGAHGALSGGDCGALVYFTVMMYGVSQRESAQYKYIETGSFAGLSAHVVSAALIGLNASALIYSHDLFDEHLPDGNSDDAETLWTLTGDSKTRLQIFYSNVLRNNLQYMVVPIAGTTILNLTPPPFHPPPSIHPIINYSSIQLISLII